jgi:hypothetical protein
MRIWFVSLLVFVFAACDKTEEHVIKSALVGGWSPEGGPDGRALVFEENGDLLYKQWDTVLAYTYSHYIIQNDSVLVFAGVSAAVNKTVTYHIEGQLLTLKGACVVDCDEKFYKIEPL